MDVEHVCEMLHTLAAIIPSCEYGFSHAMYNVCLDCTPATGLKSHGLLRSRRLLCLRFGGSSIVLGPRVKWPYSLLPPPSQVGVCFIDRVSGWDMVIIIMAISELEPLIDILAVACQSTTALLTVLDDEEVLSL